MRVSAAVLIALLLSGAGPVAGQTARLPDREQIDSSELVPHRLRLDLGGFLPDVFDQPEVYISLERTHHYTGGEPREALRVRWVANTHSHEDEVLLDAETMTVVQAESLATNIREAGRSMAYLEGDSIVSVVFDGEGVRRVANVWAEPGAFHLMMLPYWFAALDADPGDEFVLPGFSISSGEPSLFEVEVLGPPAGAPGSDLWQYRSEHGWVTIDWFIDRSHPPYLTRMIWHYRGGRFDGTSSDQHVVEAHIFRGDRFRGVVR